MIPFFIRVSVCVCVRVLIYDHYVECSWYLILLHRSHLLIRA